MNRSILVLASSTLVFGSASAFYWQAQRAGEERNTALESRVQELETRLAAAQPLPPVPLAQTSSPVTAPPAVTDANPPPRPAARAPSAATANQLVPGPAIRGFGGAGAFRAVRIDKLMQDPEYREAMRSQHRVMMSSRYPDLGEALNLQPDQVDKLMDLLTDQEIEGMSRQQPPFPQDGQLPDQAAMQEWSKQVQQRQRENEAQIASLLGDSGVQEWKDYQQTMGVRMQVRQLRGMLEGSSDPLRADQVKPLVDALAAEQNRTMQAQLQSLRGKMGAQRPLVAFAEAGQGNPTNRLAMIEQSLDQMVQNNQRTHDAVAPYLSSRQLEQFDRYQNQQLEMQRASMRMMRAQAEAEARGDIPTNSNGTSMAISQALVPLAPITPAP